MGTLFTNTSLLAKFIWRRDRARIPIWIISIVGVSIMVAAAFPGLYPPGPERDILAETLKNPAMVAMIGPSYGSNYHMGAVMAHQMLLFTALAVGIMNILLAIRHTRSDEENGRIEVIRSLPVGKLANAGATLLVLTLANLALAILMAVSLGALGLEGMNWPGSLLYGAVLGVAGIFFASATIFIAQLTESSRAAMGLSFGLLGLSYLLRAIGDISNETLSLISPLGLILRTEVYVNNYWWPILLILVASGLLALLAFRLNSIRDLETGFIAAKPGRLTASKCLQSPLGLALRIQRTTIIGWAIGMYVLGASYGSVFGDLDAFFQTSDIFELILPGTDGFSLTDQFTATLLAVLAMIGTIPILLTMLKLKSEEQANRTEHLLARAVSRWQLMGSYLVIGLGTSLLMQVMAVLGLWSAATSVMAEPFGLWWLLRGGLAYLPVLWIMVGLAAVIIGFIPKLAGFIWLYLGYTFFVIYFGGLLQVPKWMTKITPFGYVPDVPLETMNASLAITFVLIAAGLAFLGMIGYRKRDIYG